MGHGGDTLVDYDAWFQTVWDVLQADDVACLALIAATTGVRCDVELVDGQVSPEDALAYARTLYELGYVAQARDVLQAVLSAQLATPAPVIVDPANDAWVH